MDLMNSPWTVMYSLIVLKLTLLRNPLTHLRSTLPYTGGCKRYIRTCHCCTEESLDEIWSVSTLLLPHIYNSFRFSLCFSLPNASPQPPGFGSVWFPNSTRTPQPPSYSHTSPW